MSSKPFTKRGTRRLAAAVIAGAAVIPGTLDAATPQSCVSPQERQWDFWLGEWRVSDPAGVFQGTNIISRGPKGCGLIEHWTGAQGNEGMSLNGYDAVRKTWTQFWISPGLAIRLEGRFEKGALRMEGTISYNKTGIEHPFRGVWTPMQDGTVKQEFFEQDNKRWNTWFTGIYRRSR
ncbi:MAG: hypothetical protein JOZ13_05165 [Alphaproteobacteria bacterium]|nr:hypothetical protein [Alphaproteobacteria bacterium]